MKSQNGAGGEQAGLLGIQIGQEGLKGACHLDGVLIYLRSSEIRYRVRLDAGMGSVRALAKPLSAGQSANGAVSLRQAFRRFPNGALHDLLHFAFFVGFSHHVVNSSP